MRVLVFWLQAVCKTLLWQFFFSGVYKLFQKQKELFIESFAFLEHVIVFSYRAVQFFERVAIDFP